MRKEYRDELHKLAMRMRAAEHFAERLPIFEKQIIENQYTGLECWLKFGEYYKDMPFPWGINRGHYNSESNRVVTNYSKVYDCFLFCVYINTLTLFNTHKKYGLSDVENDTPIFFFDSTNSTFYATDEQIEGLLETLHSWYTKAKKENDSRIKQERIVKAQEELEKAIASMAS